MVTDQHRAFARAVVALAREHGMDRIDMRFQLGTRATLGREGFDGAAWEQVQMQWSEGRHGAESRILLRTEARQEIPETAPASADA